VLFVLVGAYNTVFGLATFAGIHLLLRDLHYLVVLVISAVLGMINAFVAYRVVVFKVKGQVALDLLRFVLVYAVALGINFLFLPVVVELVGLAPLPGQALALLLAAAGSYLAHKQFTFRRQSRRPIG
jgi:putative flippase GtrA